MQKIYSTVPRKLQSSQPDRLYHLTTGTHKIATLTNITYDDLVRNFGVPSINQPSYDDKVQVEWVFEFDNNIYTVYDWKTYDRNYTLQELNHWSIGGKDIDYSFFQALKEAIDRDVLIKL